MVKIRVPLVDDDALVLAGLRMILSSAEDLDRRNKPSPTLFKHGLPEVRSRRPVESGG